MLVSYWAWHKALSEASSLIRFFMCDDCRNLVGGLFWHKICALGCQVNCLTSLRCFAVGSVCLSCRAEQGGLGFKHSGMPGNDQMNIKCSMQGALLLSWELCSSQFWSDLGTEQTQKTSQFVPPPLHLPRILIGLWCIMKMKTWINTEV